MNHEIETYPGELKTLRAQVDQLKKDLSQAEQSIRDWQEICRNESSMAEKYKNGYDAAMRIVKSTYPDKFPGAFFISGQAGAIDQNNLPDMILVCPAYGADWSQIYEKTNKTIGPEW